MELRVHGIGGPTADSVLGVPPGTTCRAVWRGAPPGDSALRVPPGGRGTAVYHWAALTSGSRWFALWPLLLPFTMLNVAGFMRPRGSAVRGFLVERLVQGLALATTVAWVGWAAMVGQIVLRNLGPHWAGEVLAGVLVVLPFLVSRATRRAFDALQPSSAEQERRDVHTDGVQLRNPHFFDGRPQLFAAYLHAVVAALTLAWVLSQGDRSPQSTIGAGGSVVVAAGVVQVALVVTLAMSTFRMGRRWWSGSPAASAAGLGVMLLGGLVSAGIQWSVGSCPADVTDASPPDACQVLSGKPWMLVDLFGWALLVGLGATAAVVVHTLSRPGAGEGEPAVRRLLPTWLGRMRARIALLPSRLAAVVAAATATFFIGGSLVFAARAWPVGTSEVCAELPVVDRGGLCGLAEDRVDATGGVHDWALTDSPPVTFARWAFLGLLGFMGLNLAKSRAAPDVLRRVGQLWDVLTFWPRHFHPLAVRPYAERAVPELQQLLVERPTIVGGGDLIVTAHSQGSILVVAALAPFRSVPGVRLLTMGSPLRTLFAQVFPHYFNDRLFSSIRCAVGTDRWRNAFRFTDHVGRSVFADEEPWVGHADELPIPDPSSPGGSIRGHNDYWPEPLVLEIVEEWSHAEVGATDG